MTLFLASHLFVVVCLLLALVLPWFADKDARRALSSIPVVLVNLVVNFTALASLPMQMAGKVLGAVDAFTVAMWALTADALESGGVRSPEDRKAGVELRERVRKAHGLGKPPAPTPLVQPAREIPAAEGVVR